MCAYPARQSPQSLKLRNIRLTVSYDGRRYRGFEVQPGETTVRGVLEEAIQRATGEKVRLHAGARTDAGVHALGQVVSFFTRSSAVPSRLKIELADELPEDVAITGLDVVERAFHARHSAIARRYRYQIATVKVPLMRHEAYWVRSRLDVARMREAAALLPGSHDFSAFGDREPATDPVLSLFECEILEEPPLLIVEVLAERFLWKMVRRIVGALIAVGRGELPAAALTTALAKPQGEVASRLRALTAPPHGLILLRVIYPGDLKPQAAKLRPLTE